MRPISSLVADTICRAAKIGLTITSTAGAGTIAITDAAPVAVSNACPKCGRPGKLRDHILRRLVDFPVIGFLNRPGVRVPRFLYTATSCPRGAFQTPLACTDDGSKLTYRVTRWILQRLAINRVGVSATAKTPGIGWDLVNQIALDACHQLIYGDPRHLDGVRILDADEHVWKHTQKPDQPSSPVTILVDFTPLVNGRGPIRLLNLRPGRSAKVSRTWLQERDPNFRSQMQVMTMNGFADYTSAIDQVLPDATEMMNPFHVAHLVADKLTGCQQRLQRETTRRRGHKDDPLYKYRRTLLTRTNYLARRQKQRLDLLWATDDNYVALEVTQLFYQDMIATYGHPKKSESKRLMSRMIDSLRKGLPTSLEELAQLGRTLWCRREDVLAYFSIGASSGPTKSIDDKLGHLRGITLGFRDPNHCTLRCLIHSGQLQGKINVLQERKSRFNLSTKKNNGRYIHEIIATMINQPSKCIAYDKVIANGTNNPSRLAAHTLAETLMDLSRSILAQV